MCAPDGRVVARSPQLSDHLQVTDIDLETEHIVTAEVLGPDGALLHRTTGRFLADIPPQGGDVEVGQILMRVVPR